MHLHLREQVDDYDPSHNQRQSDVGWHIGYLLEHEDVDERDERDAKGTPDGIGKTNWHRVQGMRQKIERQT